MYSVREIDIKNRTHYFLNDIIKIKNLDPVNIKTDGKSYENILIYYIGYVTPTSVKPLYLIINKVNGYIDEYNGNKYLTLVHTGKGKDALNTYGVKSKILLDQYVITQTIMMEKI